METSDGDERSWNVREFGWKRSGCWEEKLGRDGKVERGRASLAFATDIRGRSILRMTLANRDTYPSSTSTTLAGSTRRRSTLHMTLANRDTCLLRSSSLIGKCNPSPGKARFVFRAHIDFQWTSLRSSHDIVSRWCWSLEAKKSFYFYETSQRGPIESHVLLLSFFFLSPH